MRGDPVLSRCECGAEVRRPAEGERPIPMEHGLLDGVPCVLGLGDRCEWCGGPMFTTRPEARCCSKRCKAALWKYEHGYGHQKSRKQCSYTKPSGLQLSYFKLVRDIPDEPMSKRELERWVTSKLSARQRALIHARNKKTEQQEAA